MRVTRLPDGVGFRPWDPLRGGEGRGPCLTNVVSATVRLVEKEPIVQSGAVSGVATLKK